MRELDTRGLAFHSPVLQPHLGELKEGKSTLLISLHALDAGATPSKSQ